MTTLVAVLGSGKGSWNQLLKLINIVDWERIILVANPFFAEKFNERFDIKRLPLEKKERIHLVKVDIERLRYGEAVNRLMKELSSLIVGVEVGVNLVSGTGKEHMVLLSSLLRLGFGIRLVDVEDDELIELSF